MKKIFLFLLVGLFAVVVAACGNLPTLESISLEGQDVEFYVGEEFNTNGLVVTAKLSDATTKVVTNEAEVSHNVDTTQAGTYTVTVTYKNLSETYDVTVIADALVNFTVEGLKTEYKVGQEVSFEGATAKETYQSGKEVAADLASFDVALKAGEVEYTGAFTKVGAHTVTISKGQVVYSYEVTVSANVYSSIEAAVNAGKANANKVSKGTSSIDNDGYVNEETYEFGENYTKSGNSEQTYHYVLLENGTVFGLVEGIDWEGNPYVEPAYEPMEQNLLGVDYRAVLNYNYDMFGAESLVETLAYVGAEAINYVEVLPTEAGEVVTYTFSFEIIIENFYYYFVNVEFSLDAETEIIKEVKVEMKGYMFTYSEKVGDYVQPTEFGEPDFTRVVTVSQEAGERNAVNPYPVDELFMESFDLLDAEGNKLEDGATISAPMYESYSLEVANINPENANPSIDQISVLVLDESGFETYSVFGGYDYGYVTVTAYKAGNYQLVISSTNVTYTFNFVVEYSPLETFVAGVYNEDWWELVEADSATVYANQVLQFGAIVNEGANDACVVTCEGALISEGEYYEFTASEVGTYVITLTSSVNPELSATITVTVEEAPSIAEILNGKYQFTSMMLGTAIYEFTPAYEGATNGVLVIEYDGAYVGMGTGYFDYAYYPGWLEVVPQNVGSYNCPFSVELDDSFNLLCTYNYFAQGNLVRYEATEGVEGALSGIYGATFIHPLNGFEFAFQLTFNVDGTGYYSLMNGAYEGSFNYVNAEGVIEFSEVAASFGADVVLTATITDNVIECTTLFTDNYNELTLNYSGGDEVLGEATTVLSVGENVVFVGMRGTELFFTPEETGTYTISIDGEIAGILIESTDVWYEASYTLELEAGVELLIVVVTAYWSTPEQNTVLTITKN